MIKHATPAYPVNELLTRRWSPYGFADRAVAPEGFPPDLGARDERPRERMPLSDFVFGANWGESSPLL